MLGGSMTKYEFAEWVVLVMFIGLMIAEFMGWLA